MLSQKGISVIIKIKSIVSQTTMSLSNKLAITDLDLPGQRVLIRVDFNVPIQEGNITNPAVRLSLLLFLAICANISQRIVAALPTIKYAIEKGVWLLDHTDFCTKPLQQVPDR